MYAIINSGGRQARVTEGDVLDIDRVASDGDLEFTPVMLVGDDGTVITDPAKLGKATVKAKVVGETKGDKIVVFKFKNKSGYRRRIGHRQKYSTIEVTKITGAPKAKSTKPAKSDDPELEKKAKTKKPEAKKTEAKKSEAKKSEAKEPEAKEPEAKEPEAKKTEAKKTEAKEPEAKEPEAKKTEAKETEAKEPEAKKTEAKKTEAKKEQEDS